MHDLIGRTLGHYRIVEKIGAGGMGEGCLAVDAALDRRVISNKELEEGGPR
jgi:serine/threonine protein kinase